MIIDLHTHCFPDGPAMKAVVSLSEKASIPVMPDVILSDLNDEAMFPIYELAFELGLVIDFHAGGDQKEAEEVIGKMCLIELITWYLLIKNQKNIDNRT